MGQAAYLIVSYNKIADSAVLPLVEQIYQWLSVQNRILMIGIAVLAASVAIFLDAQSSGNRVVMSFTALCRTASYVLLIFFLSKNFAGSGTPGEGNAKLLIISCIFMMLSILIAIPFFMFKSLLVLFLGALAVFAFWASWPEGDLKMWVALIAAVCLAAIGFFLGMRNASEDDENDEDAGAEERSGDTQNAGSTGDDKNAGSAGDGGKGEDTGNAGSTADKKNAASAGDGGKGEDTGEAGSAGGIKSAGSAGDNRRAADNKKGLLKGVPSWQINRMYVNTVAATFDEVLISDRGADEYKKELRRIYTKKLSDAMRWNPDSWTYDQDLVEKLLDETNEEMRRLVSMRVYDALHGEFHDVNETDLSAFPLDAGEVYREAVQAIGIEPGEKEAHDFTETELAYCNKYHREMKEILLAELDQVNAAEAEAKENLCGIPIIDSWIRMAYHAPDRILRNIFRSGRSEEEKSALFRIALWSPRSNMAQNLMVIGYAREALGRTMHSEADLEKLDSCDDGRYRKQLDLVLSEEDGKAGYTVMRYLEAAEAAFSGEMSDPWPVDPMIWTINELMRERAGEYISKKNNNRRKGMESLISVIDKLEGMDLGIRPAIGVYASLFEKWSEGDDLCEEFKRQANEAKYAYSFLSGLMLLKTPSPMNKEEFRQLAAYCHSLPGSAKYQDAAMRVMNGYLKGHEMKEFDRYLVSWDESASESYRRLYAILYKK